MIVTLLKMSKKKYSTSFFLLNEGNVKKTWDGIRTLINVSKKNISSPTKVVHNNEIKNTNIELAESLNNCFIDIGSTLEKKIPKSKNTLIHIAVLKDAATMKEKGHNIFLNKYIA